MAERSCSGIVAAIWSIGLLATAGGVHAAGLSCTGVPALGSVTSNPIACAVNCSAGGKLSSAIALKPRTTNSLTITIKGICVESNDHVPGGVVLQSASSGATLQAPSKTTDPVLGISGGVTINNLMISGGVNALRVRSGAGVTGNSLVIEKASNADVLITHGSLTLNTSTIENSATDGIDVEWGGVVFLNGGRVQKNAGTGVHASFDGSADIFGGAVVQNNGAAGVGAGSGGTALISAGAITKNAFGSGGVAGININGGHVSVSGSSSSVSGNGRSGILVYDNGFVIVAAGTAVASNLGNGVSVIQGGFAKVNGGGAIISGNGGNGIDVENGNIQFGDNTGQATIQNNKGNGIFMRNNSVATLGNAANKIRNNGGWGILCAGTPANPLIFGAVGTISGNKAGQIRCNTSP